MAKKISHQINGVWAMYASIGFMAVALGGLVIFALSIYKAFAQSDAFSWSALFVGFFMMVLFGFLGYFLFRVGNEELER